MEEEKKQRMLVGLIVKLITEKKDMLFEKLSKDKKSLDTYIWISDEFKKGNIRTNEFREKYKNFYGMKEYKGLSPAFFDKYFQLLEDRETDLRKILEVLSKIDHTVQLSFATKLIHTVDNNSPICDSNVRKVFGLKEYYIKNLDKRIENRIRIYDHLKEKFESLLKRSEIREIISDFKEKLGVNINDVKMLDFILWKLGENFERGKRYCLRGVGLR